MNATNAVAHDLASPANAVGNPRTPRVGVSFGHTQNKCRRFAL